MIDFEMLSPDAPAIVLLCTSLGETRSQDQGRRPLGPVAYSELADRLRRQSFQGPRDLIGLDAEVMSRSLGIDLGAAADIEGRLARAGQMGFEFDRLRSNGVWFVTVADEAYPDEEAVSADGRPLCGECVREREFIDQEVEMQQADDDDLFE